MEKSCSKAVAESKTKERQQLIIAKITGGLGNQMFQYAAAREIAIRENIRLKLDISAFKSYGLHQGFELMKVFNCVADIVSDDEIRKLLGWQASTFVRNLLSRRQMKMFRSHKLVVEPFLSYWQGISAVRDDCYLSGYWQSERYFSQSSFHIRSDFTFRQPLKEKNMEVSALISQVDAVSLHVRRGDYVNNSQTAAIHGVCSLDYYKEAINYIDQYVNKPHFFVFSDDLNWVKENIKIKFPCEYINNNQGKESFNDMRLMSLCCHNIIANSSFSWWGAWLNPKMDKLVIAPKRWFSREMDAQDLTPKTWVRL